MSTASPLWLATCLQGAPGTGLRKACNALISLLEMGFTSVLENSSAVPLQPLLTPSSRRIGAGIMEEGASQEECRARSQACG